MGKKDKKAAEEEAVPDAAAPKGALMVSPISTPMADAKLAKKVLKLAKKAAKRKQIKRGVKEVVKALRKDAKGVCVIAGDISPIDVVTPLPVLCEDRGVPYVFVPSKEELGQAGLTKRPTSCMLVLPRPAKGDAPKDDEAKEFAAAYDEVHKKVAALQPVF